MRIVLKTVICSVLAESKRW